MTYWFSVMNSSNMSSQQCLFLSHDGQYDHTIELNFLFKVIIYGIAVALIIFLISQYNDIKHMNEIIEKIQATHF